MMAGLVGYGFKSLRGTALERVGIGQTAPSHQMKVGLAEEMSVVETVRQLFPTLTVYPDVGGIYSRDQFCATPDAFIGLHSSRMAIPLELKRPRLLANEAPLRNILQVLLQMHCCGAKRGVLVERDNAFQVRVTLIGPLAAETWESLLSVGRKFLSVMTEFAAELETGTLDAKEHVKSKFPVIDAWLRPFGMTKKSVGVALRTAVRLSKRAILSLASDGRNDFDIPVKYLLWREAIGAAGVSSGVPWQKLTKDLVKALPMFTDSLVSQFFVSPSVSLTKNHRTSSLRAITGYKAGSSQLVMSTLEYLFHAERGVLLLRGSVIPSQAHKSPHRQVLQLCGFTPTVMERERGLWAKGYAEVTFDCYCTCAVGVDRCTHCLVLVMHIQTLQGVRGTTPPKRAEVRNHYNMRH